MSPSVDLITGSMQNTQYSNDTRKDANQSNKVKNYRKFKTIDNTVSDVKITYTRSPIRDTK